jgi:predicted DNA-binding transcriptional regulator YafY
MKNYINDIIRQSEILAQVLNGKQLSKEDYAEMYNVTSITIDRDLNALRNIGIQVHCKKNKVGLFNKPPISELVYLVADYLPLKLNSDVFLKQVRPFAKANKNFFQNLVLVSQAVKEGLYLKLKYQKLSDGEINDYLLKPVRLITHGLNWVLHAFKDKSEILQTFYLSRIISIELTNKKFKMTPIPEKNIKSYEMIFRFAPKVRDEIQSKLFFEEFTIDEDKEGYLLLKTNQQITGRLASWCISWWDTIQIIKPEELLYFIENMFYDFARVNLTDKKK